MNIDIDGFIQNKGHYQTIVDGNIIDNTQWNMVYDGKELDLEANRNNETIYINLNNDDIMKLLKVPAYHKSIHERLNEQLHSKHTNDIQPIIIQDLEKLLSSSHKNKVTSKKKTRKTSTEHTSKTISKNKTKSKSKGKSKHSSAISDTKKSISHKQPTEITPGYLKTIY